MTELLDQEAIDKKLEVLPNSWFQTGDNNLSSSFDFNSYEDAHEFINCIAKVAVELDHHPSVSWQYKTVVVRVTTHEVEGISEKDFRFAEMLEECNKK